MYKNKQERCMIKMIIQKMNKQAFKQKAPLLMEPFI